MIPADVRQRLNQAADLGRGTSVFIGGLTNLHHLLQRRLHGVAFRLRLISHSDQNQQLKIGSSIIH